MVDRGWTRGPQILANLYPKHQVGHVDASEDLVCTKGDVFPLSKVDRHGRGRASYKVPALVELVICRDSALGHDAKQLPCSQDKGSVVELASNTQRSTQNDDGIQVGSIFCNDRDSRFGILEQQCLLEEILAGIARHAELGKYYDLCPGIYRALDSFLAGGNIVRNIGHFHLRCDRRNW